MTTEEWQLKDAHVQKVVEIARTRLEGPDAEHVGTFIAAFYADVAPDDLFAKDVDVLFGQALSMWRFSQTRAPGAAKLRVYNPSIEEHGWRSRHTVIEIVNDDMPFLVDSLAAELTAQGREIYTVVHPVLNVVRDKTGERMRGGGTDQPIAESVMFLEIDEQTAPDILLGLEERLVEVFAGVRASVEDWHPMQARLQEAIANLRENPPPISPEELEESIEFLHWLADDHFTFLGCREYVFSGDIDNRAVTSDTVTGLGVLRDADYHVLRGEHETTALAPEVAAFLDLPEPLIVMKTNRRSVVHRPVHMDYVGVKQFDSEGTLVGECRFVGLFTSVAYNRSPRAIPLLRRKVAQTIARAGFDANSHNGKALINVLEKFPRDELLQINTAQLFATTMGILRLQEQPRPKAFLRFDNFERFVTALVFVPKENYDTPLRHRIQDILAKALGGTISEQFTEVGTSPLARLHIIIRTEPGAIPEIDLDDIDRLIAEATRSWQDKLKIHLVERFGEEAGNRLWSRFGTGFSVAYQEEYLAKFAVFDVEILDRIDQPDGIDFNIYRRLTDSEHVIRLKIYHASKLIPLSECLPKLENLGLKVIEEDAFAVQIRGSDAPAWVHDFYMHHPEGTALDISALKERLENALGEIWSEAVDDDSLNALVVTAGLEARQITVLRASIKYLRQAEITFSQSYMRRTLLNNTAIAADLVGLFERLFDPVGQTGAPRPDDLASAIAEQLEDVGSLDEDRILRRVLNLMQAMLRTNYFQAAEDGNPKPYLSFKLNSRVIDDLPLPRPHVEIFVYSPRVEGVHLRGGKVARGGLRWSDRPEDFRTEILGLVKAQMVKNAVIVPVGAKGGFVPKQLPVGGDREAVLEEGIACYKLFISGLLDLTDNLVDDAIVPPVDVIRLDDDDPYLVVAADKGTATFSDIANGLSQDRGFWMDDAFASGGTYGYDHKKMAITARGAWVCTQRHFRELGLDIQKESIQVIGIGDMSGDVFGNGLLCSRTLRLVAAFDHRDIFIDPDPDPETSFIERERLFALPRSSWADYDSKLISQGGGVFERTAKSIPLSAEVKVLLDIDEDAVTPNKLIQEILKAQADLLWIGGIGTYVKAQSESDDQVGDRANDAVRIDGNDLRVKVVGEGGNLGLTQHGRIEFALAGGRINTDAVDNSGGVDCSDHEVNIKILLGALVATGDLTTKQRNELLEEMTDEVSALVLAHNYRQSELLSSTMARAPEQLETQARFIRGLEKEGLLNRDVEFLPGDEEISERLASGQGLTRPELSVLMAYAKMALFDRLMEGDVPDEPWLQGRLIDYFPTPIRERFAEAIGRHRLRREIVATVLANEIINRAGITYVSRVAEESGVSVDDIARGYVVAREVIDLGQIWEDIDGLDNEVDSALQTDIVLGAKELLHRKASWFVRHMPLPLDLSKTIGEYAAGACALLGEPESALTESELVRFGARLAEIEEGGVPHELAKRAAAFGPMASACDIVYLANETDRTVDEVARAYFAVGDRVGLDELREASGQIVCDNHWDRMAIASIVDDLYDQQREYAEAALADGQESCDAVDRWIDVNEAATIRARDLIAEVKASGPVTLAKLGYVSRQLRSLFGSA